MFRRIQKSNTNATNRFKPIRDNRLERLVGFPRCQTHSDLAIDQLITGRMMKMSGL
jgi:hypothetical protein